MAKLPPMNLNSVVTENIVLIGMPGCGKTVIGQALAKMSKRLFFDIDDMVENMSGLSVARIITEQGEAAFRTWEHKAVALAAAGESRIIATGGGTVLDEKNNRLLSQNGRLYFIERELLLLPTAGRPLSSNTHELYHTRLPYYLLWACKTIKNDASIEEAAFQVLKAHI